MPPKQVITASSVTYDDIFHVFDTTGVWPQRDDKRFGHLIRYMAAQFKRVANGHYPSYGRYGFTSEVQAGFRKRGYVLGSVGRKAPSAKSIIVGAIEILSQGEKLSGEVANTLRKMARHGRIPAPDESRLTSLGFRF